MSEDGLEKMLGVSIVKKQGMESGLADARLKEEGPNELEKVAAPGIVMLFVMQLLSVIMG